MSEQLLVVLLGIILALLFALKSRETFIIKYGNPFKDQDLLSFEPDAKGTRLFATSPDTCPLDRPEYDAGLCYPECEDGYNGIGPVCWAYTKDIGPGILADFRTCQGSYADGGMELHDGYVDIGLLCFYPGRWDAECEGGDDGKDAFGNCFAWNVRLKIDPPDIKPKGLRCPGRTFQLTSLFDLLGDGLGKISESLGGDASIGEGLKTNINNFTDLVDGLCYRKCPANEPHHISGMPYLCTKGDRGLSYGRGVGTIPPLIAFGA